MAEHEEVGAERSLAQKDEKILRTNTVLAISAILLSAISAGGVIWQVKVAADQRAATVWPYIQTGPARSSSPPFFAIQMVNAGVGPAVIRYFAVRVDDKPVRSWREFLAAVSADDAVRRAPFDEGVIAGAGWVMAPQVPVNAFATAAPEAVNALPAQAWRRIQVSYCYCSIFNACWVSDWQAATRGTDPQPVGRCPTEGKFGVEWSELDATMARPSDGASPPVGR
jgi:hypothetical protein